MNKDIIEFYYKDKLLAFVDSSFIPPISSFINIRKVTYKIENITFALDHADEIMERRMRCNIDLSKK
jgi:hypothetical protein